MVAPMPEHGVPSGVHGPCERCGVRFTTGTTTPRPRCPNCGHRGGCRAPEVRSSDQSVRVPLGAPARATIDGPPGRWPVN